MANAILMMLAAVTPIEVESGWLSAYGKWPTVATRDYRMSIGDIPRDLSRYDGMIAVRDCSLVGKEALLVTESAVLEVIIFDCAGRSDGGREWMADNNIVAEIGWGLRQRYPEIVFGRAKLMWRIKT